MAIKLQLEEQLLTQIPETGQGQREEEQLRRDLRRLRLRLRRRLE